MATATYPPPPPYYRLYKDYSQNPNSTSEPPPPIEGTYVCFGGNYTTDDLLPSLEDLGVWQLYPKGPNIDFKKELRSLNRELQLHILELADVLVRDPHSMQDEWRRYLLYSGICTTCSTHCVLISLEQH